MDTLRGALECVDIKTGELHRPEHVQALIEGVAQRIEIDDLPEARDALRSCTRHITKSEAICSQAAALAPRVPSFNALRPYLYVHKGATQGFLDLFRAWFSPFSGEEAICSQAAP